MSSLAHSETAPQLTAAPANGDVETRQLPRVATAARAHVAASQRLRVGTPGAIEAIMVLRIEPDPNDSPTLLKLVGRIASPDVQELKALISEMPNPVALDLQEVELVDLDAVRYLAAVERGGLELRNLPPYVRAWVLLERERLGDSE